jgi:ferredoxin-NADP reductase
VAIDDKSGKILIDTDSDLSSNSPISSANAKQENMIATSLLADDEAVPARPVKMQLKLREKISHEGSDIMSFRFSRSDDQNYLYYEAGQFSVLDLGTKEDPKGPTRSFTIASSPTERDAILITTRIRDTPFKQRLSKLDEGTAVKITAPAGNFTLPQDYSKPLVFLSGGIGVTPFRSMIKYATDKQLPVKITMFDSNRNQSNTLFKDEFDSCAKVNKNLRIIYTITEEGEKIPASDWKGERGYIDKTMLKKYLTKDELVNSIFYICGPPAMLSAMQQLLSKEMEVPQDRIRKEIFAGY